MAITVVFDGRYRNKISHVSPDDIVLKGRSLTVKRIRIPVADERLYDLFYFLEEQARYKHGKVTVALLVNGDIRYHRTTTDDTANYYAKKFFDLGSIESYSDLYRNSHSIPAEDEYMVGREY